MDKELTQYLAAEAGETEWDAVDYAVASAAKDAELDRLRAEVERLRNLEAISDYALQKLEAKVARVKALADEWERRAKAADRKRRKSAQRYRASAINLRAALNEKEQP